jgi:hypothetical protein
MINESKKNNIKTIWDKYVQANKTVLDTKGNVINNIDETRIKAIVELKIIINSFLNNELSILDFRTAIDSYNKRNNLWGFTATKGQMFFNQLTKYNEQGIEHLATILKAAISEPSNLNDALAKIESLELFANNIFSKSKDKRKAPNPGSAGYFLSYFWQIHNHQKWPILYTSLVTAFKELDIWQEQASQKAAYEFFYNLNEEVKNVLKSHCKREITNWDAEHAFWNFTGNPNNVAKKTKQEQAPSIPSTNVSIEVKTSFNISDYLIPKISKLIEIGSQTEKSASSKGSEYEQMVAEIFKLLDFEVELLGQGTGRNPDAIIKFREEHTAFIVDAKAYLNGYVMSTDDRAIREYISYFCPKLEKDGFRKIGFIIVSNSFKSDLTDFIDEITWNTPVKRFILLTSEALLYLLAYKTKDKLSLSQIIDSIKSINSIITAKEIIETFDDF